MKHIGTLLLLSACGSSVVELPEVVNTQVGNHGIFLLNCEGTYIDSAAITCIEEQTALAYENVRGIQAQTIIEALRDLRVYCRHATSMKDEPAWAYFYFHMKGENINLNSPYYIEVVYTENLSYYPPKTYFPVLGHELIHAIANLVDVTTPTDQLNHAQPWYGKDSIFASAFPKIVRNCIH